MVAAVAVAWLLLWAAACAQREQDFYDFKVVNIRGKLVSLEKYRGTVSAGAPGVGAPPDRACRGWGTPAVWGAAPRAQPARLPSALHRTACSWRQPAVSLPRLRGKALARSET